jgi:hypothetical protein
MAAVHSGETNTPDQGTWVQASSSNPSYVKIVIDDAGDARVQVITSDTNGVGAGGEAVHEPATVTSTGSVVLPAGTYYIAADIIENETTVDVEVVN